MTIYIKYMCYNRLNQFYDFLVSLYMILAINKLDEYGISNTEYHESHYTSTERGILNSNRTEYFSDKGKKVKQSMTHSRLLLCSTLSA